MITGMAIVSNLAAIEEAKRVFREEPFVAAVLFDADFGKILFDIKQGDENPQTVLGRIIIAGVEALKPDNFVKANTTKINPTEFN